MILKKLAYRFLGIMAMLAALTSGSFASAAKRSRDAVIQLVTQIQRSDYEGDRTALKRLYGELTPFLQNKHLVSRVEYWRGFALWRRALNGFNESVDPKELQEDLEQAVADFKQASAADPSFTDAKIGAGSCLSNLMFLNQKNTSRMPELIAEAGRVLKEARAEAPENPRLYWVLGPNLWYAPAEHGGSQSQAIEMYQKGLELTRTGKGRTSDPLEPSWGEPELLMNLAWSNLHRTTQDLKAAKSYAQSALDLVPYWHYVKDILMPQIDKAIDMAIRANAEPTRDESPHNPMARARLGPERPQFAIHLPAAMPLLEFGGA
ncbi:MAG: hypothetical protein WB729_04540 [Candidatus Sulfotelmatobacter sp.]